MSAVSTKKETILRNGENRVMATIDWDHSSPWVQFPGTEVKLTFLKKTGVMEAYHLASVENLETLLDTEPIIGNLS